MDNKKIAVIKITANKNKNGFDCKFKTVLESKDNYCQARNPFFKFLFDEIAELRGEN